MKKRIEPFSIGGLFLAILLLIYGCDGPDCAPPECSLPKAPPASHSTGDSGGLIVTDLSGSMRGFARPNSVQLYIVHNALERAVRNAMASIEPGGRISRCYLGRELDCNANISLEAMDRASTYSEPESRLDLFMRRSGAGDSGEDPIDPYRIAVLITDGMQARASSSSAPGPCLAGADPDCIAYLLTERIQQGYGVWLAVLLLPFRGQYFAERPVTPSDWQRIQAHISQLVQDPYFQGITFRVLRPGPTSYTFQGVRPLLVLALSKDKQLGRTFVREFSRQLRSGHVTRPDDAIYTMELAPLDVRPGLITNVSLDSPEFLDQVQPIHGERGDGFYDYLIECDHSAEATFTIEWEQREGIEAIPDGSRLRWELVPSDEGNLPTDRLLISGPVGGQFKAQLSTHLLKEGCYARCYILQARLEIDPQASPFWMHLHADNMIDAPERLYGLKNLVQTVLENTVRRPFKTDILRFRVERK
ncbi:MAG: hypothetical protein D6723_16735 [Acidobacteria bacterium]|nr:MAG: hypothetical protein D6723_16735 [Acidobacteriota bacterium]